MLAPTDEFRAEVAERSAFLRDADDTAAEAGLVELLDRALAELTGAAEQTHDDDPRSDLVAVEAWASLLSHALIEVYAPASPLPRRLAGFARGVVERIEQAAGVLRAPLGQAQQMLGADSYSISLGFPWGISVGLSWS